MTVLYITEFADVGHSQGVIPSGAEPANISQTLAIGATTAASSAFQNNTSMIRLHTDSICSVAFGVSPSATATSRRMAANQTEYFTVPIGKAYQVAVISNT